MVFISFTVVTKSIKQMVSQELTKRYKMTYVHALRISIYSFLIVFHKNLLLFSFLKSTFFADSDDRIDFELRGL